MTDESIMRALSETVIASILKKLIAEGKLQDFIDFAREQAKKDGMDTENLMNFFDELEEQFVDEIDWIEIADICRKCTGCPVQVFKGDKTIIIENEKFDDLECLEYLEEKESKIKLSQLNNALSTIGIKLEFIEALNLPFDLDGFENFIRFKVVELDRT